MATLLHISDLHFGWPYVPHVGEALLRLASEVNPTATIVSGDLVQRGDFEKLWIDALAFVRRFPAPQHIIPGNHDIPLWNPVARFLWPFSKYRKHVSHDLEPVVHVDGAVIVGISTPRSWTVDLGYVSRAQIAKAKAALQAAPREALRVVSLHHPPLPQPEAGLFRHHVRNYRAAQAGLADMGAEVVVSGHNHYPKIVEVKPEKARGSFIYAQAGTACSKRFKPESGCTTNAVNVIRSEGKSIEIEVFHFDAAAGKFTNGTAFRFERAR